ncbi:MAG: hypothetical protein U9O56_09310 [Campylobacterota bacterium]|nr:hypothetical protein [Campylobacterota bacterium]
MNILVADTNKQIANLLESFKQIKKDINIFEVSNYNNGIDIYNNNKIDLIIIHFDTSHCIELLNSIVKINSSQNTITISDSLCYSEDLGCEYCITHYNRKKLLLPFDPKELFDMILNFNSKKCKYFKSLDHIEDFLGDMLQKYSYFIYDSLSKQIKVKDESIGSSSLVKDLVNIINMLNNHNIKYSIQNDTIIQISSTSKN